MTLRNMIRIRRRTNQQRINKSAFIARDVGHDLFAEQTEYLSRLGVHTDCALRDEQPVVDLDVEHAARARDEHPLRDHALAIVKEVRNRAHGTVRILKGGRSS